MFLLDDACPRLLDCFGQVDLGPDVDEQDAVDVRADFSTVTLSQHDFVAVQSLAPFTEIEGLTGC